MLTFIERLSYRWNSKTGDWEIIAPLLMAVYRLSASVIDNKIYVTGGRALENGKYITLNKVQMYSTETNSWVYCAHMIQGRSDHSVNINQLNLPFAKILQNINNSILISPYLERRFQTKTFRRWRLLLFNRY